MKFNFTILFFLSNLLLLNSVKSQTPYSSQNFNLSTFFNPATTGFGINNKVQSFFRTQYEGVGAGYKTIGISADFALLRKRSYDKNNTFGFGIQAISEQILNGVLQKNAVTVSLANRLFLDGSNSSNLALGVSASFLTSTIDGTKLTFGDQYNSGRLFNASSMEMISQFPSKFSSNVGLLYTYSTDQTFFQIGGSLFYINRSANDQFFEKFDQSYQTLAQLNFEKSIWEDNTLVLHANYQNRFETEFFYTGLALSIPFNPINSSNDRIYFGCFYRTTDAVIPYLGLNYNRYKFGLTYEIYQAKMALSNLRPQTFELSISTNISGRLSEKLSSIFN